MVIPMQRKDTDSSQMSWQERLQTLPLGVRRCGAWVVEVSLIVASGVVPFSIGLYAKELSVGEPVPLNPVLTIAQDAIGQTLALPVYQRNRQVAPATNLLWTAALVAPLLVASWQIYRLAVRGQTLPKRWVGVQVVAISGDRPSVKQALLREGLGKWGLPVTVAFAVWRLTGAYPDLGVLTGFFGLLVVGDGLSCIFDRQRRTLHDKLAKTLVIDATKATSPVSDSFPPLPPRWLMEKQGSTESGEGKNSQFRNVPLLWELMRRYPRRTALLLFPIGMAFIGGSFIATQIYIQTQETRRLLEQQRNQVFVALVRQLTASANANFEERKAVILAIGSAKDDPRTLRLLVELLGQEKEPRLIEIIQQLAVKIGPDALPELQQLNQTLGRDWQEIQLTQNREKEKLASEQSNDNFTTTSEEDSEKSKLVGLRLRATQEAIANILRLDRVPNAPRDLSQTKLSAIGTEKIDTSFSSASAELKKDKTTDSKEKNKNLSSFALSLEKADLSGINFRGATLNNANFQASRFWGPGKDGRLGTFDDWVADFSGAEMRQANLNGAILNDVLLVNTNLSNANLNQANLSQADLNKANLNSAKLIGTSLQKSYLKNASLTGADLTEANFSQANLHSANLNRVIALGTQFEFADLTQSDWREADLSGANFRGAKIPNANFSGAKLAGTDFGDANLQNANFRNADLKMADFRGANLEGADFQAAIFAPAKLNNPDRFVQSSPKISQGPRVQGVNFSKVKNLDARQLSYICAQGGHHPRCQ